MNLSTCTLSFNLPASEYAAWLLDSMPSRSRILVCISCYFHPEILAARANRCHRWGGRGRQSARCRIKVWLAFYYRPGGRLWFRRSEPAKLHSTWRLC